ncbi:regulator of G-protein signaling 22 [Protopterus annectens]|uniref:regulator of G-protein signaling 22 n=1 Tax=Protopterus annectens TaxID=7888 RepID=UPI001CFB11D4|nr:regulator of G-protein signaling 22 [Protopterus annectens]
MRVKKLTTEPINLRDYEFEDCLATDNLLVDYFNSFLSLPTFPEPIKFNKEYGVFEVINDVQKCITDQIKSLLRTYRVPNPIYDVVRKASGQPPTAQQEENSPEINIDTNFNVTCLDREQGVQWIKQERLPLFLQSDCYFEYRLAKLMSQLEWSRSGVKLQIDPLYYPWPLKREPTPVLSTEDENEKIMKDFYVSLGQTSVNEAEEWFTLARKSQETETVHSLSESLNCSQTLTQANLSLSAHTDWSTTCSSYSSSLGIGLEEDLCSHCVTPCNLGKNHHQHPKGRVDVESVRERPKSMNENCFVFIHDSPSAVHLTTFVDQKSESGIDTDSDQDDHSQGDIDINGLEREGKGIERHDPHIVKSETGQVKYDAYNNDPYTSAFRIWEEFAEAFAEQVLQAALTHLFGEASVNKEQSLASYELPRVIIDDFSDQHPPEFTDVYENSKSDSQVKEEGKANDTFSSVEDDSLMSEYGTDEEEPEKEEGDGGGDDGRNPLPVKGRHHDFQSQKGFERFKKFLIGTSGEKYWSLWLDIERLKVITDTTRKKRHLRIMKTTYLVSSGVHFLNTEILSRLGVSDAALWTEEWLCLIQPDVLKPLLLYWGPRYCLTGTVSAVHASAELRTWKERHLRPKTSVEPHLRTVSLLPLRSKSCVPKINFSPSQKCERLPPKQPSESGAVSSEKTIKLLSTTLISAKRSSRSIPSSSVKKTDSNKKRHQLPSAKSEVSYLSYRASTSLTLDMDNESKGCSTKISQDKMNKSTAVPEKSNMEAMLQALHFDSKAGYFFMQFCEHSGNKLWNHSIHFWFDLQEYLKLFCQEAFHPFEVKKQAQFLYTTYVAYGASKVTGVDQAIRRKIYQNLDPPFEDLFDPAEDYVLTLLLVAWVQMSASDRATYKKVELFEQARKMESVYTKKLKALQEKICGKVTEGSISKLNMIPVPDVPKDINLWNSVPEEYRNYSFGTLIRNRMELQKFREFLEDHFASMDLLCWMDIEQFRRIPHKEREKREEKSKEIKTKYLNKKYFFGPSGPATREQQEQVIHLGGGWGKILQSVLPSPLVIEVQKYVKHRLEKKWLPLFLATPEFMERQKKQVQIHDIAEDHLLLKHRKRREVWRNLDNKWISSSKEIIAFRKALLNPVTGLQFQRFVSLKGDYLENGVLFWLEVQKYKDMCHSHIDDGSIHNKVNTIISCFINSSIPPALQIDIPLEQAEQIIQKKRELGPYVFREAQMTVFGVLFKLWPAFCEFRNNLAEDTILPVLEKKKEKKLEKLKRKMKEEEMKQEEANKKESFMENLYGDSDSNYSGSQAEALYSDNDETKYVRNRHISWSYSKYIEALEQEKMLSQMQSELERKSILSSTSSSLSADVLSIHTLKMEISKRSRKSIHSFSQDKIPLRS